MVDTSVRDSLEIPAARLNLTTVRYLSGLMDIAGMHPSACLELRPYKFVVYQDGGHFEEHRDTVRGDNHIGTLVLILNSEYTGGALEISHGNRTEVVTGTYNWVAMYGDCLHKINPVTSGTRVSLIYDILTERAQTSVWDTYSTFAYSRDRMLEKVEVSRAYSLEPTKQEAMLREAHKVLAKGADLAICLQHLYPACQATPKFLKGGDQVLYDAMQGAFATSIVPVSILRITRRKTTGCARSPLWLTVLGRRRCAPPNWSSLRV